jgi:hypothetical protein
VNITIDVRSSAPKPIIAAPDTRKIPSALPAELVKALPTPRPAFDMASKIAGPGLKVVISEMPRNDSQIEKLMVAQ